jgi:hypothetical protein
MHGAGSASRDPTAEFRAGQIQFITNDPEQRRVGLNIKVVDHPIHF